MKPQISLITILTNRVPKMTEFYRDVLGFKTESKSEDYVEFETRGVRFAICNRKIMFDATGHETFKEDIKGQSFELAFPCNSAEEVAKTYTEIIAKGAVPVKEPTKMPWGQTTAFFADPDGNIHEIFTDYMASL
jgi:catechol 2,3-dioxygenase-like lactoylglutathione lyase family enzyme